MTIEELRAACEGREFLQLVSPDGKRPIPRVQAELLCCSPSNGQSVWLYKTKAVLRVLDRIAKEAKKSREKGAQSLPLQNPGGPWYNTCDAEG